VPPLGQTLPSTIALPDKRPLSGAHLLGEGEFVRTSLKTHLLRYGHWRLLTFTASSLTLHCWNGLWLSNHTQ